MNNDLIHVKVIGFSPAQQPGGFAVFLQDMDDKRCLPIIVGAAEAQAISMMLNPEPPPRPMTHDTFKFIIDSLRGEIIKVVITKLEENTFYADIYFKNVDGDSFQLDARPSDSIAIALKNNVPIFVSAELMDKAAIVLPDEIIAQSQQANPVEHGKPIDFLKDELEKAIENEDYETAAKLRDEIKKLERK
ncbi:MAG: hypothetical protein DRI44_07050 [Chlamydiae bacterium]|nr:MAG: hypothetical protein DRI44_07050 [Chlamydiota bacterium]